MIRNAVLKHLADLDRLDADQLVEQRQKRLAGFGQYKEGLNCPQLLTNLCGLMTFDSSILLERLRALTAGHTPVRWVVGFSGGIDSTVLLHALANSGIPQQILAVHVDHGLHPDSGRWEAHCRKFAENLGVDYDSRRVERAG